MEEGKCGNFKKIPIGSCSEVVEAEPKVKCTEKEVLDVLIDLSAAVDAKESGIVSENVLIYIKINDRKIPYKKVFIISFHKNRK